MRSYFSLCLFAFLFLQTNSASTNSRIVGGREANAGEFPYVAAIHVTTYTSKFFCGGTLIGDQHILTAAQCLDGAVSFTIQLGSNKLNANEPTKITLAASEYYIHPKYNSLTLDSDIGLIRLRLKLELSDYIKSVYNLPLDEIPEGWGVLSPGWGQISNNDAELAENLQFVSLTSLTNQECKITYGSQVTDNMLCAAGNYNEGTCLGDTGSPLIYLFKYGNPVPYGVASFVSANGCESPDPSGFTRVYPFVDWIVNITQFTLICAELPKNLKFVTLTSFTNEECKITYGTAVTDNMVCTAGNYNEGTCIGDTGSPLTLLIKNVNPIPYDGASFVSANGCESVDPSGFTRVFPVLT